MGQYRLVRRLAGGGMAEVMLAKVVGASGFEKPVAIKRMLPEIAKESGAAAAFLAEARLCVSLVHPNVVQVLDLGTHRGEPFIVMELVDGEDLRRVITASRERNQPMSMQEAMHITLCVAEALAYAYEAQGPGGAPLRVVHRDVNPANVLVSMRGEVKLTDFGVAKASDGREATQGNLIKGKLQYLAPELLTGGTASHASDVFLAGALLYELAVGQALFASAEGAPGVVRTISKHDEKELVLPEFVPPEVAATLRKAVARDPAARHAHARDLARELQSAIDEHRWRVSTCDLARRMSELFPDRPRLDLGEGPGVPLFDEASAPAPAPALAPAPARQASSPGDTPRPRPPTLYPTPAPMPRVTPGPMPAASLALAPPARPAGPPRPATPQARPVPSTPQSSAPVQPAGRKRLGEMLVEAGVITAGQLQNLLLRQKREGGKLGELVIGSELAPVRAVLSTLGRQLGIPYVTDEKLLEINPPAELIARVPQQLALRLMALPLTSQNGLTHVAMCEPGDLDRVDNVRFALGGRVRPVVATEFGLRRAIARTYGGAEELKWRQLDASDPRISLTTRLIDLEATPSTPVRAVPVARAAPTLPISRPPNATPTSTFQVAYVPSGFDSEGRPLYVAVPVPQAPAPGTPGDPDGTPK